MKILLLIPVFTLTSLTILAQDVKKCDQSVLTGMSEKAGKLTEDEIRVFLLTLGKECKENSEFSEWSNELLFLLLDKQTSLTLLTMNKIVKGLEMTVILDELRSPISDAVDIRVIIGKVENVSFDKQLKTQILRSLRRD